MVKNKSEKKIKPLVISPKSSETRWVALNRKRMIISEGKTPTEAIDEARKGTKNYILMFIPEKDSSCFF